MPRNRTRLVKNTRKVSNGQEEVITDENFQEAQEKITEKKSSVCVGGGLTQPTPEPYSSIKVFVSVTIDCDNNEQSRREAYSEASKQVNEWIIEERDKALA